MHSETNNWIKAEANQTFSLLGITATGMKLVAGVDTCEGAYYPNLQEVPGACAHTHVQSQARTHIRAHHPTL